MRAVVLTVAAALALAGCAETQSVIAPLSRNVSTEDPVRYVDSASSNALFETQSAQLALTRSQHAGVRAYAQEIVKRTALGTQSLNAAATASGLTLPTPELTASQAKMLGDLQEASAEEFDALYLEQQREAQQDAIVLHEAFALAGEAPRLRDVALSETAKAHQYYQEVRRIVGPDA